MERREPTAHNGPCANNTTAPNDGTVQNYTIGTYPNIISNYDAAFSGPKTLLPEDVSGLGVRVFHNMEEGIRDCDVVIMLRLQNERMNGALLPSAQEFFQCFGLTQKKLGLAKPDAIVMHPGPMNRGVEIASDDQLTRFAG